MRPSDDPAGTDAVYDHVVVGAGLSGLAYAWRRQREGRRVVVLEAKDGIGSTPLAVVKGPAAHLERLVEALPGVHPLRPATCGPFLTWARGGPRPATPSLLRRVLQRPGSVAAETRSWLEGDGPEQPVPLRVLPGGVGALREALVERLGPAVCFGLRATRVCPLDDRARLARVATDAGTLAAHEVVLDAWSGAQARLLSADAPHHADVLQAVPYADVVEVWVEAMPGRLPAVAGLVRTADSPGRMRSALFVSHLLPSTNEPERVLVHLEGRGVARLEASTVGRIARAELDRALGRTVAGPVRGARRLRSPRPEPGHRGRLAALAADLQGRGVRLAGPGALGEDLDRLAAAGIPVAGPLPEGATVA